MHKYSKTKSIIDLFVLLFVPIFVILSIVGLAIWAVTSEVQKYRCNKNLEVITWDVKNIYMQDSYRFTVQKSTNSGYVMINLMSDGGANIQYKDIDNPQVIIRIDCEGKMLNRGLVHILLPKNYQLQGAGWNHSKNRRGSTVKLQ